MTTGIFYRRQRHSTVLLWKIIYLVIDIRSQVKIISLSLPRAYLFKCRHKSSFLKIILSFKKSRYIFLSYPCSGDKIIDELTRKHCNKLAPGLTRDCLTATILTRFYFIQYVYTPVSLCGECVGNACHIYVCTNIYRYARGRGRVINQFGYFFIKTEGNSNCLNLTFIFKFFSRYCYSNFFIDLKF